MHDDRIKIVGDLEAELRGLPEFNHFEMQAAQELALVKDLLQKAQFHRTAALQKKEAEKEA